MKSDDWAAILYLSTVIVVVAVAEISSSPGAQDQDGKRSSRSELSFEASVGPGDGAAPALAECSEMYRTLLEAWPQCEEIPLEFVIEEESMVNISRAAMIGAEIRRLRELAGMTQLDLAVASEVSQGSISRMEAGTSLASITNYEKVASALGADPDELMKKGRK